MDHFSIACVSPICKNYSKSPTFVSEFYPILQIPLKVPSHNTQQRTYFPVSNSRIPKLFYAHFFFLVEFLFHCECCDYPKHHFKISFITNLQKIKNDNLHRLNKAKFHSSQHPLSRKQYAVIEYGLSNLEYKENDFWNIVLGCVFH